MPSRVCDECGAAISGPTVSRFCEAFLDHAHTVHPNWPFPDVVLRNFAEATQRSTGPTRRLDSIGLVAVRRVSPTRIGHWLRLFDHDVFAGDPVNAVCYCTGPHCQHGMSGGGVELRPWRENRGTMVGLLRTGRCVGYLVYVDGKPAGWLNASKRSECTQYRRGAGADPADTDVISIACFAVAPPYRGTAWPPPCYRRPLTRHRHVALAGSRPTRRLDTTGSSGRGNHEPWYGDAQTFAEWAKPLHAAVDRAMGDALGRI